MWWCRISHPARPRAWVWRTKTLAEAKPSIIVCDISGYGKDGPYRDKKAYDLLIQSEAGFLSVTGTDADPVKAGCSIADIAAGMYAYSNILAALLQRQQTGRGAASRYFDARIAGRVDELSPVLCLRGERHRRRAAARATRRSIPTADSPLEMARQ